MSVYYEVTEHLKTNSNEMAYTLKPTRDLSRRISLLAAQMMHGQAEIRKLELCADGEHADFSGSTVTGELDRIIRLMDQAESIDLFIDYSFQWKAEMDGLCLDPMGLNDELEAMDEESLSAFYYTLNVRTDCSKQCNGYAAAFGLDADGRLHRGTAEYTDTDDIPTGDWVTELSELVYSDQLDKESTLQVDAIVSGLIDSGCIRSAERTRGYHENTLRFYDTELKTPRQAETYVTLLAQLHRITNGSAVFEGEFRDRTAKDPRSFRVWFDRDIHPCYSVANA